jgi:hypothetical protein
VSRAYLGQTALPARLVFKESRVLLVRLESGDLLVSAALRDHQECRAYPVSAASAVFAAHKASQELQEVSVHQVCRVLRGLREKSVHQGLKDLRGLKVFPALELLLPASSGLMALSLPVPDSVLLTQVPVGTRSPSPLLS